MLSKTTATAQCVNCGTATNIYSLNLKASVCSRTCERAESDRIYAQLIEAEEVQPEGELQARKRAEVTQDKWRVSIS